jgi:hypothetical protein
MLHFRRKNLKVALTIRMQRENRESTSSYPALKESTMKKLLTITAVLAMAGMTGSAFAKNNGGATFSWGSFNTASASHNTSYATIVQVVGPTYQSSVTLSAVIIQNPVTQTIVP